MSLSLQLILLLLINNVFGFEEWDNYFDHKDYLDVREKGIIYWTPHTDDCIIEFGLEVETSGWAAIGISLSGGMVPSDIILGWVDDNTGEVFLNNYYALIQSTPILHEDQNGFILIDGWQDEVDGITKTYLHFEKDLFPSNDRENAVDIAIGTTRVIYAWNDNDGPDLQKHLTEDRGPKSMNLLSGDSIPVPLPDDAEYYDLVQPNVEVPSADTTYWCTLLELPHYDDIQHIVRIDPVIQSGNEGIVHHIVLYICPEQYVDTEWINKGFDCDEWANMPTEVSHCRGSTSLFGWAVGGKNFYFPEHVGLEMGGTDTPRHIMIETHFDNPQEESGYYDSSGLRLWYTPTLREQSAFGIGVADGYDQFIPPGVITKNYAYLTSKCTDTMLPEEGVKIFATGYHQHTLGVAGIVRHIRNGIELKPIEVNLAYDFNFQQFVPLKEEITILPGDEIIVECTVDSTSRTEMTYGGESTRDEMCSIALLVYPKPAFLGGGTVFADKADFLNKSEIAGYYNSQTGMYDATKDGALAFYNEYHETAQRYEFCMGGEDDIVIELIDVPEIIEEYDGDYFFGCNDNNDDNDDNDDIEIIIDNAKEDKANEDNDDDNKIDSVECVENDDIAAINQLISEYFQTWQCLLIKDSSSKLPTICGDNGEQMWYNWWSMNADKDLHFEEWDNLKDFLSDGPEGYRAVLIELGIKDRYESLIFVPGIADIKLNRYGSTATTTFGASSQRFDPEDRENPQYMTAYALRTFGFVKTEIDENCSVWKINSYKLLLSNKIEGDLSTYKIN